MRRSAILALACVSFMGCVKEEAAWPSLQLTLRPTWNGADFDKNTVYLNAANERVQVSQVKFFLSNITLTGRYASSIGSEAELFDLTDGAQAHVLSVNPGEYDQLHFGLGLPPGLNHADITDIDPSSPLGAAQGMYWTWATMYRFMIFDGRFDTDPGGTGTPPFPFSIHTGRDECYRERSVALPLKVARKDAEHITLDVDLAGFFGDGDQVLDLSQGNQSHGSAQELPLAMKLSDLAVKAINPE